uniref:Ig-like domain-containing protein n=1 Tax=Oryctolagus cuniculus TaxID=9986 RepID=A0A5F9DKH7_RABIT
MSDVANRLDDNSLEKADAKLLRWAAGGLQSSLQSWGSQTSSNSEKTMTVVTKPTGSSVTVTCSIPQQSGYIHWYRFQEGKAPQRLLYYDFSRSSSTVDSGFSPGKYHAYEGSGRSYKFVARNLEESDSGVYYCAIWTGTAIHICPKVY